MVQNNQTAASLCRSYAAAGTYWVRISGSYPWINFGNIAEAARLDSIDQW